MGDMADFAQEAEEFDELVRLLESPTRYIVILHRRYFVWTDIHGARHKLKDIDDSYLANIINYLRVRNKSPRVIAFLESEQLRRLNRRKPLFYRLLEYIRRLLSWRIRNLAR